VNGPTASIIDCEGGGQGFTFDSGEATDSILDGFTITGCTASNGGAISIVGSDPTIRDCVLDSNNGDSLGGAVYCEEASPVVTRCTFTNNTAGSRGGGMHLFSGSDPAISDCLFADNTATIGGAISTSWSSPDVRHCTMTANTVTAGGGAFYAVGTSHATLTNSIAGGDAENNSEIHLGTSTTELTVSYSNVGGGADAVDGPGTLHWLAGNLDVDPAFADPVSGDYHLSFGSDCVDAGDPEFAPEVGETDIDGESRVAGTVDMGADEFHDCNGNRVADHADILDGTSDDVNGNTVPDECECITDLNGDGIVSTADLLTLLGLWGSDPGGPPDFDGDGNVGTSDLVELLANWGSCP
jgi:hypothetical protein